MRPSCSRVGARACSRPSAAALSGGPRGGGDREPTVAESRRRGAARGVLGWRPRARTVASRTAARPREPARVPRGSGDREQASRRSRRRGRRGVSRMMLPLARTIAFRAAAPAGRRRDSAARRRRDHEERALSRTAPDAPTPSRGAAALAPRYGHSGRERPAAIKEERSLGTALRGAPDGVARTMGFGGQPKLGRT